VRPGYPPAALDAVLPAGAGRVADIGAGTGRLTRALAARWLSVIAVEPDEVAFAQSWHWVDGETAACEAARVLVPGGLLAMLWNLPEDRVPWVAQRDEMTGTRAGVSRHLDQAPALEGFGPARRLLVPWQLTLRPADLLDLTRTWSSVITLGEAERERMLDAVRHLVATDPALAGRDEIAFPYVCAVRTYRVNHR
jgi:SAM-dependent methyltransferase